VAQRPVRPDNAPPGCFLAMFAGGGDVVGGDRVAEHRQRARPPHVAERWRCHGHSVEVRRVLHVGRARIPGVELAGGHFDIRPVVIALEPPASCHGTSASRWNATQGLHLRSLGQMSARCTGLPSVPVPSGSVVRSRSSVPAKRIRHHQRRGGEEVHAHLRMHTALEVAIAGQHRAARQITRLDGRRDLRLQRPELPIQVVQP